MTGDRNEHTFPDEVPGWRQEMILTSSPEAFVGRH
jgi:hypothetical protein